MKKPSLKRCLWTVASLLLLAGLLRGGFVCYEYCIALPACLTGNSHAPLRAFFAEDQLHINTAQTGRSTVHTFMLNDYVITMSDNLHGVDGLFDEITLVRDNILLASFEQDSYGNTTLLRPQRADTPPQTLYSNHLVHVQLIPSRDPTLREIRTTIFRTYSRETYTHLWRSNTLIFATAHTRYGKRYACYFLDDTILTAVDSNRDWVPDTFITYTQYKPLPPRPADDDTYSLTLFNWLRENRNLPNTIKRYYAIQPDGQITPLQLTLQHPILHPFLGKHQAVGTIQHLAQALPANDYTYVQAIIESSFSSDKDPFLDDSDNASPPLLPDTSAFVPYRAITNILQQELIARDQDTSITVCTSADNPHYKEIFFKAMFLSIVKIPHIILHKNNTQILDTSFTTIPNHNNTNTTTYLSFTHIPHGRQGPDIVEDIIIDNTTHQAKTTLTYRRSPYIGRFAKLLPHPYDFEREDICCYSKTSNQTNINHHDKNLTIQTTTDGTSTTHTYSFPDGYTYQETDADGDHHYETITIRHNGQPLQTYTRRPNYSLVPTDLYPTKE